MRATPARQPRYLIGVASWGVLLTITLVGVALTIRLVGIGIAGEDRLGDDRLTFLVSAVAALVGGAGACVMAGAALSYQARPSPRPPVSDAVVWRPPFVYRAGVFVSLVGLSAAAVAIATLGLRPGFLLPSVAVLLVLWFAGSRVLIENLGPVDHASGSIPGTPQAIGRLSTNCPPGLYRPRSRPCLLRG
jgi:hypothetical protein